MLKYLLGVLVILIVAIVGFLAYLGAFSSLEVTEKVTGPYNMAYVDFTGEYAKTGPVFSQVFTIANQAGLKSTKGIGIYLDDPKVTPKEKQRSQIGVVVEKEELAKISLLKDKLKIKHLPAADSVVIAFPLKNILSYMIGPMKAYPKFAQYLSGKNLKVINCLEVYDMPAQQALYIMQIEKQIK
jgi:hypothetical protein